MLDDFREQASTSPYYEEPEETFEEVKPYRPKKRILGMTAGQRLVIALMLLFAVCILARWLCWSPKESSCQSLALHGLMIGFSGLSGDFLIGCTYGAQVCRGNARQRCDAISIL